MPANSLLVDVFKRKENYIKLGGTSIVVMLGEEAGRAVMTAAGRRGGRGRGRAQARFKSIGKPTHKRVMILYTCIQK